MIFERDEGAGTVLSPYAGLGLQALFALQVACRLQDTVSPVVQNPGLLLVDNRAVLYRLGPTLPEGLNKRSLFPP